MIFRELSPGTWHRDSEADFDTFLRRHGMAALTGLDTRALTQKIRDGGPQNAVIAPADTPAEKVAALFEAMPPMAGSCLVGEVSVSEPVVHGEGETHIVLLDFGIKAATIHALVTRGCRVTQVPWNTSAEAIAALEPDGIMLSNGPGDPAAVPEAPATIATLIERYPVMGICMGFQLMGRALGGATLKLPFGHHGGNHPVCVDGRVEITAQNHGFALAADSLDGERVEITHVSLFDGSLEGFRLRDKPVFGVQFHPEAAPGPHDSLGLFDQFLEMVRRHA